MLDAEPKPILCARCHTVVDYRLDADGEPMAVCPACGARMRLEDAIREAAGTLATGTHGQPPVPSESSARFIFGPWRDAASQFGGRSQQ